MSASESSPLTSNLHQSSEQLIAETVRRSQTGHDAEVAKLLSALKDATSEIEAAQSSLNRALTTLKEAMGEATEESAAATEAEIATVVSESLPEVTAETESTDTATAVSADAQSTGPHTLDLIAHDVTIGIATGLQSMLRSQPEVSAARTREFVNGELRLNLDMNSGLNIAGLQDWIAGHNGRIATQTASVIELRFDN